MRFLQYLGWLLTGKEPEDSRAKAQAHTTVKVRVIRADGTVEDLGVVSRNGKPSRRR